MHTYTHTHTYYIKQTIREQYPEEEYELSIQSVKFSDDSHDEPAIGVEFRENLGGWLFSLQGGRDKKVNFYYMLKPNMTIQILWAYPYTDLSAGSVFLGLPHTTLPKGDV